MRTIKYGLFAIATGSLFGSLVVVGCSAQGGIDDTPLELSSADSDAQVTEDSASTILPPSNNPNDAAPDAATKDAGKDAGKDAPDDDDAGDDAGPSPEPGDACPTRNQLVTRSCGKCGKQQAVCQSDVDAGLAWSVYGPCVNEMGECVPGETMACGDCGTTTCSNLCGWGVCQNEPSNHCSPGSIGRTTAGCPSGGFKSRSCGDTCQWSTYSLACNLPKPVDLFAGSSSYSTFMRGSDGGFYAWGKDDSGQLGDGTTGQKATITPTPLGDIVSASGAGQTTVAFTCAAFANGSAKCWGTNSTSYTLGDGSTSTSTTGITPTGFDAKVVSVTTGVYSGCGLFDDGTAKCWGHNTYGTLGNGATTASTIPIPLSITGITQLAIGNYTTCARTSSGTAYCWGYNTNGQVGDGSTTTRTVPVSIIAGGVASVAPGIYHTCAVMADGTAKCWGQNTSGEVGNAAGGASSPNVTSPATVAGIDGTGQLGDVTEICAGYGFSCARLADGRVACWGKNDKGQLGNGTAMTLSNVPTVVTDMEAASKLVCGYAHACVIENDRVKCWGGNGYSQLGNGSSTNANTPQIATF